jgi:hypothetical protein
VIHDFITYLQEFILEVIISQKYNKDIILILTPYRTIDVRNSRIVWIYVMEKIVLIAVRVVNQKLDNLKNCNNLRILEIFKNFKRTENL